MKKIAKNSTTPVITTLSGKINKVAKYPTSLSKHVYTTYEKQESLCSNLKSEIESLKDIIRNKKVVVLDSKGQAGNDVQLSSIKLKKYKRELIEKRYILKLELKKLKVLEVKYSRVNKKNKEAAQSRIGTLNRQIKLARLANKKKDDLQNVVSKLIQTLESKKDPRITGLRDNAINNGLKFYTGIYQIVRSEMRGQDVLSLLNSSGQVRTEIFKLIRQKYGYQPKR